MKMDVFEGAGNDPVILRHARDGNLEAAVALLAHLGYETEAYELEMIFHTVLNDPTMNLFLSVNNDGEITGMISLRHSPALRLNGYQVSIEEMVVVHHLRGQGIGKKLLHFACQYARQKGAVRLEILISQNRESYRRKFYQENGFTPVTNQVHRVEM